MKQVLSLYRQVVGVLSQGGRRFINIYSGLLASLSVLDAAALALLAIVIGPVASGGTVTLPFIGKLDSFGVLWAIAAICALMIIRSLLAILVTYWATRRIARYEIALGDRLLTAFLMAPWRRRLGKNSSDIMQLSNSGVDVTVSGFVMPGATILSEIVGLVVVVGTLGVVQPILAVVTLLYLGLLGLILAGWLARRAHAVGAVNVENSIRTSRLVLEIVSALKEVALRGKEREVAGVVREARTRSAQARATIYFLGTVPRFILEAGLIGGFVVIGGVGFAIGGVEQAISAVALFGLAGFRVAPSVTRLQSVLSSMSSVSQYPRRVVAELTDAEAEIEETRDRPKRELAAVPRTLKFRDVRFNYGTEGEPAIRGISLDIPFGSSVAFVGSSGSGKSTMVDLILGLLEPTSGDIDIDGVPLHEVRDSWRRRVGFVPQEVAVFDASIGQNVALTWGTEYDRDRARSALEQAQLWELVAAKDGGLDAPVGERGMSLSGGQRQRLGIARALYAEPLVLVLDEATSALDTHTESQVTSAIEGLGDGITRVVVAHRLATIMKSDKIFFLREGELAGTGTFEELVSRSPDFARQAELAGLA